MKKFSRLALIFVLSMSGTAMAQEVYVCTTDSGAKEYRNTNITKNCKRMDIPSGTTVPAPPAVKKAVSQLRAANAAPATSPSEFPKVDSATQKARDSDRRQILVDEMTREEQKLAELRREYNGGEPERRGDERNYAKYQERVANMKVEVVRTEKNVEALKREIGNLK